METEVQAAAREAFDELVRDVRTDLHRYCSRMVGSSIEGEDVSEDDIRRAEKVMQDMTDTHTAKIDSLLAAKEEELLEV